MTTAPTYHSIPVEYGATTTGVLNVEKREWRYRQGNDETNATFEHCVPWDEITRKAVHCSNKCLPVIFQHM